MTSPLEVLKEIKKFSPTFVVEDEIYYQVLDRHFLNLLDTLQSILEMPFRPNGTEGDMLIGVDIGYNTALAEVHKLAEGMRR